MAWFKRTVMRWLKLPPDPEPPAGSTDSVRVFRAAPNYYRYALARWVLRQVGVVAGLVFLFGFWLPFHDVLTVTTNTEVVEKITDRVPMASWVERWNLVEVRPVPGDAEHVVVSLGPAVFWFEVLGLAFIALQFPFTHALVRLDYEQRWYIVTDRSLRIREGLTTVHESTMTFANIQNLAIVQGPIQRLLGIADLRVRTAGGGSSDEEDSSDQSQKAKSMHIGYFRGVDNAHDLRDSILADLQRLKDAGLDEPPPSAAPAGADDAVEAARVVLDEVRAMRAAIQTPG